MFASYSHTFFYPTDLVSHSILTLYIEDTADGKDRTATMLPRCMAVPLTQPQMKSHPRSKDMTITFALEP